MSEDEEDEEEGSEYADDNESFADVDDLEGKPYYSRFQPGWHRYLSVVSR